MGDAVQIGMCFDRTYPAAAVVEFAERLDTDGVDQLWVIEDCFYTAGISLAATALARTERLAVGLGILPAVARNPAITAMEIATLAELAPGRLIAGIGHGVQIWMDQIGARPSSPLTTFEEVVTAVRRLLTGDTVDVEGRSVVLRDVTLDQPPAVVPPLLAGVRGPKSLALAGRICDGIVLAEGAGPFNVNASIAHAGSPDPFRVAVFSALCLTENAGEAHRLMAPFVAGLVERGDTGLADHPHIDEIGARYRECGVDGIADMPAEWWIEIGAIGTLDDVVAHVEALVDAGASDISLFPGPTLELGREDLDAVATIAAAVR